MKKTQKERLQKTIAKGKIRFIVVDGMLGWGLLTGILFSLSIHFFGSPMDANAIVLSLILFAFGGVIWGHFVWVGLEKALAKEIEKQS